MKIRFGKQNPFFDIPDAKNLVKCIGGESIFFFGKTKDDKGLISVGVGTVVKIEKGNEMDMVMMNFGFVARRIIVKHNHARRQIYTLKKGQLAWFYGFAKYYDKKLCLFAKGFQGWYVPKALDIKNYDDDQLVELEQEQEQDLVNFLDQFIEGDD